MNKIWFISLWLVVVTLSIFALMAYLMQWGYTYESAEHWVYDPVRCSLACADRGCVHPVRFPGLYNGLVRPQIAWLKQTGAYKQANLAVYFLGLPVLYGTAFVRGLPFKRVRTGFLWLIPFMVLLGLVAGWCCIETVLYPWGRAYLYWGATNWCVELGNALYLSLPDVYTLLFGLLIPLSAGLAVLLLGRSVLKQVFG